MNTEDPNYQTTTRMIADGPAPGRVRSLLGRIFKVALPIVILVGGGSLALGLIQTGPTAERKPPVRQAKLVEAMPVQFTRTHVTIEAMGTVRPDREVELRPRVGGQVIWLSEEYVPGGVLTKGQRLLKIDPKDYELVVQQKAADLAKAESNLKIEQGQQSIAKREYELLGQMVTPEDRDLVLRGPQLASVEAELETVKSTLAQAKLDLARTNVTVPFNAVIKSRDVNLGTQVTTSTTVSTLIGTDSYLIEVSVPVNQLKWLRIPRNGREKGAEVRIFNEAAWGADAFRIGYVVRLASQLESEGRMAQLLVAIDDPLALTDANASRPVLLIGTYVRVAIAGQEIGPVAVIERKLLHDGNSVWIMTPEEKLEIRRIEILFRGPETVLVDSGLRPGERIVTTTLSAAVEGMSLRTKGTGGGRQGSAHGPDRTDDGTGVTQR